MSDQLQDYRRIVLDCDFVNDWVPPIIASTGDLNGRIIVAKVTNNGSVVAPSEKLHAQLLVNPKPNDEGYFGDYVSMEPVSGFETAAFSCAIPYGAVSKPGRTRMGVAFLADNDDGTQDIICTRPFNVEVEQGVLRVDSDSAIGEFEENVRKAEQAAANAAESAEDAAGSASAAAESANSAADSAKSASSSASEAATSASNAAQSETAAAGSASNAEASANAASGSATAAKESQDAAAESASSAAQSAETASNAATEARNAVDGFGLTVGDTTTSEPGGNAVVTIEKTGTRYVANFTIPRGEQGPQGPQGAGIQSVSHDDTLTGDGTSSTPLGVADGTAINPFLHATLPIDLNDIREYGWHVFQLEGVTQENLTNAPDVAYKTGGFVRAAMFVSNCGYDLSANANIQVWFNRGGNAGIAAAFMRTIVGLTPTWSTWSKFAFTSDIPSDYVSDSELASKLAGYATDTELSQGLQAESAEREKQDNLLEESINGKIAPSNVKAGTGIATSVSGSDVTVSASPTTINVTFEASLFSEGSLTARKAVTGLGSVNMVSPKASAANIAACQACSPWLADHQDDSGIPAGQVQCTVSSVPTANLQFVITVLKG